MSTIQDRGAEGADGDTDGGKTRPYGSRLRIQTSRHTFLRLLQLALPVKNWMFLAALLGSVTVASGIGLAATSAYLISAAALHPSVAALQIAIVSVRFFGIARGGFRYLERLVSHKATFRLLANLRVWFYNALEPLLPAHVLGKEGLGQARLPLLGSGDL